MKRNLLWVVACFCLGACYKVVKPGGAKTTPTTTGPAVKVPKYLCVYYGWPSLVDGAGGDLTTATADFARFDLIVFGDGIWKDTHGDHINTTIIISGLNTAGKAAYGYVDLGVSTQNLSVTAMKQAVNGWDSMGVKGIFWDDAGYDYGTTRARQDTMINYCHQKGLHVIMNAWNPDDVMGGTGVAITSGDTYLLESYLISEGNYTSLTDWKTKADKCAAYQTSLGVKMACLSSGVTPLPSDFNTTDPFTQAWFGAAIYNFDYFQATDENYSASNNTVYYFPNISSAYGTTWRTTSVTDSASVHFYRSTDTWTLHVHGDGATWGYGGFTQP
jgi:hypothetical protein